MYAFVSLFSLSLSLAGFVSVLKSVSFSVPFSIVVAVAALYNSRHAEPYALYNSRHAEPYALYNSRHAEPYALHNSRHIGRIRLSLSLSLSDSLCW
jgi:hypothetical protein